MLNLENLQRGWSHLTNDMLENEITWWKNCKNEKRDLILPRLLEERLRRMEFDYEEEI